MQYVMPERGITVTAMGIMVTVQGFGDFKLLASQYLLDEGIGKPAPDGMINLKNEEWYDAQAYLNAWKRIANEVSEQIIENSGRIAPDTAEFPPTIRDIESGLASIDVAYHMNHKKNGVPMFDPATGEMTEGIGHYRYQRTPGKQEAIIVCDNPYPCAFDRGLITAMAQRFQPRAQVTHDPKSCRKRGAHGQRI